MLSEINLRQQLTFKVRLDENNNVVLVAEDGGGDDWFDDHQTCGE